MNRVIRTLAILISLVTISPHLHAIARYKAIPLNYLIRDTAQMAKNTLSFEYQIFKPADCKKFLGRSRIISKGYRPIQINIINNSDRYLSLNLANFSLPCACYEEVAQEVHFNTTKRALAWGIPGLFIWPFLIPAIMEIVQSPKANSRLLMDYSHKALSNQVIEPFSAVNGIVFVAKEQFNPAFSFTLIDRTNGEQCILSTMNQNLSLISA